MDDNRERERIRKAVYARRRRKQLLPMLIMLLAAAAIAAVLAAKVLPSMGGDGEESGQTARQLTQAQVLREDITDTVYGSGTIQHASQPGAYALCDAEVAELLVGLGDQVREGEVIARLESDTLEAEVLELEAALQEAQEAVKDVETHTQLSYRPLYYDDGKLHMNPDTGEPLYEKYSTEISIYAPGAGRIMAIYIEPGDDALAVYRDRGAVMLLSTDGRMKIELENPDGLGLELGEHVRVSGVYEGETIDAEGSVVSLTRRGTEAIVQIGSDELPMGATVRVLKADGTQVGEGALEINKPLAVSAYGGTIKGVGVKVGDLVTQGELLARIEWDEIPLYIDNAAVLREYVKAQAELEAAQEKLNALYVAAPCDGRIASVDVSVGDSVTDGTKVMSVVKEGDMTLILSVDELDIPQVKEGQQVSLSVDALEDVELEGVVQKIAPLGNTETGVTTYDVYIAIAGEVDSRVLGGMNVSGEIAVNQAQDALTIPTDALLKVAQGYHVTMADGSVRDVTLGVMTDERTQILDGLDEGESVVY